MEFNMKKVKFMPLFAALVVAVSLFPVLVHGDANTDNAETTDTSETTTEFENYSSDTDPLVSLSYINKVVTPEYDKKIEDLNQKIEERDTKIEELDQEISKLNENLTLLQNALAETNQKLADMGNTDSADTSNAGIGQYEVVFLEQGSKLMAKSPCEIILRTGSAIAVSIISNGLNDMTEGTEILNAYSIPLYHALLVPRGGDGRGIQITSPDAYVMVRGEYEIVQ